MRSGAIFAVTSQKSLDRVGSWETTLSPPLIRKICSNMGAGCKSSSAEGDILSVGNLV